MPRFKDTTKGERGFNLSLTPMIDIIFQLLIFFMIGMKFKIPESKIDTFLPTSSTEQVEQQDDLSKYTITIKPRGTYEATFLLEAMEFKSIEELKAELKRIAGLEGIKTSIVIDAKPGVAFDNVMEVLNECVGLRLEKISFARPEP